MLLRRRHYPLHLIPFASAVLYLLAAPLGALLAVAISATDGEMVGHIPFGDLVAPVLGAWLVTAIGAVLNHRFRRDREVRVAVIGSHEFTRGLQAELAGGRGRRLHVSAASSPSTRARRTSSPGFAAWAPSPTCARRSSTTASSCSCSGR